MEEEAERSYTDILTKVKLSGWALMSYRVYIDVVLPPLEQDVLETEWEGTCVHLKTEPPLCVQYWLPGESAGVFLKGPDL